MTARVALAVALLLALHAAPAAGAGSCTDPVNQALYDNALQQLATCETAVGFPLEPPLAPARTAAVCNDCSALAAATRAKQFGDCTLASGATGATTTLQARMDALFACSPAAPTSGSGSGADDIVTPTPRPSTATPKPAVTLLLPSTSGSDGSEVPTPTTSQPRTPGTAEEPNDSGSGSESTSGTGKGSSGKSRGSGSSSGLAPGVSTSSGASTALVRWLSSDVSVGLTVCAHRVEHQHWPRGRHCCWRRRARDFARDIHRMSPAPPVAA